MAEPDESGFPSLNEPAPRARRGARRGTLLRWLMRSVVAALLALLVFQIVRNAPIADPKVEKDSAATLTMPSPSLPESIWRVSVVAIESRGSIERKSHGCGFIVGQECLVATNLHVAAGCTDAVVRLVDGTTYEIAGYAAIDFDHDLTLLALKDAPDLPPLPLNEGPPQERADVWAVGHPQGKEFAISAGKVEAIVPTSALPAGPRHFASQLARDALRTRWLRHTASLAPGSSGGPLLDAAGKVVGINTWIDRESGKNYAVDAAHLAALLRRATADIVPLITHATTEAKLNDQLLKLSPGRLRELVERGRSMSWQPRSREQYRILQQLAWAITVARHPDTLAARGVLGDRLDALAREAETAVAELRKEKWNDVGQITILNEFAEAELAHPPAGLVFFASVERTIEEQGQPRGIVVTLAGFDQQLFLPIKDQLLVPQPRAQCLVLGALKHEKREKLPVVIPGAILPLQ